MKQCLFEFDIAARESLDVVQTERLYGITERGVLLLPLFTDSHEPLEVELHFETVALAGFHQALLVQQPPDECRIEPPLAFSIGFDQGRVGGRIPLDIVLGQVVLLRVEFQYLFRGYGNTFTVDFDPIGSVLHDRSELEAQTFDEDKYRDTMSATTEKFRKFVEDNFKIIVTVLAFFVTMYVQHTNNTARIAELQGKCVDLETKIADQYDRINAIKLDKAVFEATMTQFTSIQYDLREMRADIKELLKNKQ